MRNGLASLVPVLFLLGACGGGGSGGGGGGGGDATAALATLGLAPRDLTDVAGGTMLTTLNWAIDDVSLPTLAPGCPTATQGADDNSNGHPDTLSIVFDCTDTEEDLALEGSIQLTEYLDPADFLTEIAESCSTNLGVGAMGAPSWGMRGVADLTGTEGKGIPYGLSLFVALAEFPDANKYVVQVSYSFTNYVVEGAGTFLVQGMTCFTLAADDSSDVPSGYIETFFYDGKGPAVLSLECVLLSDGSVSFDAWGAGDDLIASGTIDVSADADDDEIVFD
ncbi:MAG: hypothetical protein IPJ77_08450 [Planctomycetes bacterium]|nr:hypothetical protein [Planctomycetota bacterium]